MYLGKEKKNTSQKRNLNKSTGPKVYFQGWLSHDPPYSASDWLESLADWFGLGLRSAIG